MFTSNDGAVRRGLVKVWLLILALIFWTGATVATAEPQVDFGGETSGNEVSVDSWKSWKQSDARQGSGPPGRGASAVGRKLPHIITTWETIENPGNLECASGDGRSISCVPPTGSCQEGSGASTTYQVSGDDVLAITGVESATGDSARDGSTVHGTQTNSKKGTVTDLGWDCVRPGQPESGGADTVVITVTAEDFAKLPVKAPVAHAGPERGWLPVNMVNVLYTEAEPQLLETELLDTPLRIRATPVQFHWDLGDGNTITTSDPGKPFPSERISSEYRFEGWYDITLTTTFTGQFSVDGGPWQDIDGSIEVESDPVELFAKSLESRLVNGEEEDEDEDDGYRDDEDEYGDDEDEEPWIPERTPATEGPLDPEARHREI